MMDIRAPKNTVFRSAIAFLLIVGMLASTSPTTGAQLAPSAPLWPGDISKISIPSEQGTIKEIFQGRPGSAVIFIQDAHVQYDAQKNIARLLKLLNEKHGAGLIGVEGYEGPADFSFFRTFPDKEATERVFDRAMQNGGTAGVEYFAITNDSEPKVVGVDNEKLYVRNISQYVSLQKLARAADDVFRETSQAFANLKSHLYSKEARQLDGVLSRYRNEETDLLVLFRELQKLNLKTGKPLDGWPAVKRVFKQLSDQAEDAETDELKDILPDIEESALLEELDQFIYSLRMTLAHSAVERELLELDDYFDLMNRGRFLALTRSDADRLTALQKTKGRRDLVSALGKLSEESGVRIPVFSPDASSRINEIVTGILNFYEDAQERDKQFIDSLSEEMKERRQGLAALVAGGFHTSGIVHELRKRKISYAVVSPAIAKVSDGELYRKLMIEYGSALASGVPNPEKNSTRLWPMFKAMSVYGETGGLDVARTLKTWGAQQKYHSTLIEALIRESGNAGGEEFIDRWLRALEMDSQSKLVLLRNGGTRFVESHREAEDTLKLLAPGGATPDEIYRGLALRGKLIPEKSSAEFGRPPETVKSIIQPSSSLGFGYADTSTQLEIARNLGFEVEPGSGRLKYRSDYRVPQITADIWVVRHGETENIAQSKVDGKPRFQGQVDGPENQLNPAGKEQGVSAAREIFGILREKIITDEKNVVVLRNNLGRVRGTSQPFLDMVERETGKTLAVVDDADAREIRFGEWDNLTYEEIEKKFGPDEAGRARNYRELSALASAPSGESFIKLLERAHRYLLSIEERFPGKTVVLFNHGTFSSALRVLLKDPRVLDEHKLVDWRKQMIQPGEPFHLTSAETGFGALSSEDVFGNDSDVLEQLRRADAPWQRTLERLNKAGFRETAEMVKLLFPLAVRIYYVKSQKASAIHHIAHALDFMSETMVGEGVKDRSEIKRGIAAALLHDVGIAKTTVEKVRKVDVEESIRKDKTHIDALKLPEVQRKRLLRRSIRNHIGRAIQFRETHMKKGSSSAAKLMYVYNEAFPNFFSSDDIREVRRLIEIHDNPSIQAYEQLKNNFYAEFGISEFETPKNRLFDADDRLMMFLREADRLWMITKDGIDFDLSRKQNGESVLARAAKSVSRFREEAQLYIDTLPDAQARYGFKNGLLFRTESGYKIFERLTRTLIEESGAPADARLREQLALLPEGFPRGAKAAAGFGAAEEAPVTLSPDLISKIRKPFKLIISDLDYTLIPGRQDGKRALEPETAELMKQLDEYPVHFAAVTRMGLWSAKQRFASKLKKRVFFNGRWFVYASNGALGYELNIKNSFNYDSPVFQRTVVDDISLVDPLMKLMEEAVREVAAKTGFDADRALPVLRFPKEADKLPLGLTIGGSLSEASEEAKGELAEAIRLRLREDARFKDLNLKVNVFTRSVELSRVNKEDALRHVVEVLGIQPEDIVVIGDSFIDDSMFSAYRGMTKVYVGETPYENMPSDVIQFPIYGPEGARIVLKNLMLAHDHIRAYPPQSDFGLSPGEDGGTTSSITGENEYDMSRAYARLDNSIYTPVIHAALKAREFVSVRYDTKAGAFVHTRVTLDDGTFVQGGSLSREQMQKLQRAFENLSEEDQDFIRNDSDATLIFFYELDDDVSVAMREAGKTFPEPWYGSHYSLSRTQYYLDIHRLAFPAELSVHLRYLIAQRRGVLAGLSAEERGSLMEKPRPLELVKKIDELTERVHSEVTTAELVEQAYSGSATKSGRRIIKMSKYDFLLEYAMYGYLRPGQLGYDRNRVFRLLNRWFGEGGWGIKYQVGDQLVSDDEALQLYEDAYYEYFQKNPHELNILLDMASDVYDTAISNTRSGLDYHNQSTPNRHIHDIAIRRVVKRLGMEFRGAKPVQIRGPHSEGFRWNPGLIPFHRPELIAEPALKGWWNPGTAEDFYQSSRRIVLTGYPFPSGLLEASLQMLAPILSQDILSSNQIENLVWAFKSQNFPRDDSGKPRKITDAETTELLGSLINVFASADVIPERLRKSKTLSEARTWQLAIAEGVEYISGTEFIRSHTSVLPAFFDVLKSKGAIPLFLARDAITMHEFGKYVSVLTGDKDYEGYLIYQPGTQSLHSISNRTANSRLDHVMHITDVMVGDILHELIEEGRIWEDVMPVDIKDESVFRELERRFSKYLTAFFEGDGVIHSYSRHLYDEFKELNIAHSKPLVIVDTNATGRTALYTKTVIEYFSRKEGKPYDVEILLGWARDKRMAVPELSDFVPIQGEPFHDLPWPFRFEGFDPGDEKPLFKVRTDIVKLLGLIYQSIQIYNAAVDYASSKGSGSASDNTVSSEGKSEHKGFGAAALNYPTARSIVDDALAMIKEEFRTPGELKRRGIDDFAHHLGFKEIIYPGFPEFRKAQPIIHVLPEVWESSFKDHRRVYALRRRFNQPPPNTGLSFYKADVPSLNGPGLYYHPQWIKELARDRGIRLRYVDFLRVYLNARFYELSEQVMDDLDYVTYKTSLGSYFHREIFRAERELLLWLGDDESEIYIANKKIELETKNPVGAEEGGNPPSKAVIHVFEDQWHGIVNQLKRELEEGKSDLAPEPGSESYPMDWHLRGAPVTGTLPYLDEDDDFSDDSETGNGDPDDFIADLLGNGGRFETGVKSSPVPAFDADLPLPERARQEASLEAHYDMWARVADFTEAEFRKMYLDFRTFMPLAKNILSYEENFKPGNVYFERLPMEAGGVLETAILIATVKVGKIYHFLAIYPNGLLENYTAGKSGRWGDIRVIEPRGIEGFIRNGFAEKTKIVTLFRLLEILKSPSLPENFPSGAGFGAATGESAPYFDLRTKPEALFPMAEIARALFLTEPEEELKVEVEALNEDRIELTLRFVREGKKLASISIKAANYLHVTKKNPDLSGDVAGVIANEKTFHSDRTMENAGVDNAVIRRTYRQLNWMAKITLFDLDYSLRNKGIEKVWYENYVEPFLKKSKFPVAAVQGICLDCEETSQFWREQGFAGHFLLNPAYHPDIPSEYFSAKLLSGVTASPAGAGFGAEVDLSGVTGNKRHRINIAGDKEPPRFVDLVGPAWFYPNRPLRIAGFEFNLDSALGAAGPRQKFSGELLDSFAQIFSSSFGYQDDSPRVTVASSLPYEETENGPGLGELFIAPLAEKLKASRHLTQLERLTIRADNGTERITFDESGEMKPIEKIERTIHEKGWHRTAGQMVMAYLRRHDEDRATRRALRQDLARVMAIAASGRNFEVLKKAFEEFARKTFPGTDVVLEDLGSGVILKENTGIGRPDFSKLGPALQEAFYDTQPERTDVRVTWASNYIKVSRLSRATQMEEERKDWPEGNVFKFGGETEDNFIFESHLDPKYPTFSFYSGDERDIKQFEHILPAKQTAQLIRNIVDTADASGHGSELKYLADGTLSLEDIEKATGRTIQQLTDEAEAGEQSKQISSKLKSQISAGRFSALKYDNDKRRWVQTQLDAPGLKHPQGTPLAQKMIERANAAIDVLREKDRAALASDPDLKIIFVRNFDRMFEPLSRKSRYVDEHEMLITLNPSEIIFDLNILENPLGFANYINLAWQKKARMSALLEQRGKTSPYAVLRASEDARREFGGTLEGMGEARMSRFFSEKNREPLLREAIFNQAGKSAKKSFRSLPKAVDELREALSDGNHHHHTEVLRLVTAHLVDLSFLFKRRAQDIELRVALLLLLAEAVYAGHKEIADFVAANLLINIEDVVQNSKDADLRAAAIYLFEQILDGDTNVKYENAIIAAERKFIPVYASIIKDETAPWLRAEAISALGASAMHDTSVPGAPRLLKKSERLLKALVFESHDSRVVRASLSALETLWKRLDEDGAKYDKFVESFVMAEKLPIDDHLRRTGTYWANPEARAEFKEKMPTFATVMTDNRKLARLLMFLSVIRAKHGFTGNLHDVRAPLVWGEATGSSFIYRIGELYVAPLSESFRRHIIYTGDKSYMIEIKFPGERTSSGDVSKTHLELPKKLIKAYPENPLVVEPIFFAGLKGDFELYRSVGARLSFEEFPFGIAAFRYEDGKRLKNVLDHPKNWQAFVKKVYGDGPDAEDKAYEQIGADLLAHVLRVHRLGYSTQVDSDGIPVDDLHLENFRLMPSGRVVSVADFGSYRYLGKRLTARMRASHISDLMDRIWEPVGQNVHIRSGRNRFMRKIMEAAFAQLMEGVTDRAERKAVLEYAMEGLNRKENRYAFGDYLHMKLYLRYLGRDAEQIPASGFGAGALTEPRRLANLAGFGLFIALNNVFTLTAVILMTALYANLPEILFPKADLASMRNFAYVLAGVIASYPIWFFVRAVMTLMHFAGFVHWDEKIGVSENTLKSRALSVFGEVRSRAFGKRDGVVLRGLGALHEHEPVQLMLPDDYERVVNGGKRYAFGEADKVVRQVLLTPSVSVSAQILRYLITRRGGIGTEFDRRLFDKGLSDFERLGGAPEEYDALWTPVQSAKVIFWKIYGDYELLKRVFRYSYPLMLPYIIIHSMAHTSLFVFQTAVSLASGPLSRVLPFMNRFVDNATLAGFTQLSSWFVWNSLEPSARGSEQTSGRGFGAAGTTANGYELPEKNTLSILVDKIALGTELSAAELERLKELTLLDGKQRKVFGVTPENVDAEVKTRIELFRKTLPAFRALMKELEIDDLTPLIFWNIYVPLSLWLYRRKLEKRPEEAYVIGFSGGLGVGKTTRTKILGMVLAELLKERGEKVVIFSIDDLYKTKAEREALKPKGYFHRGPPGTHDVKLGVEVLRNLRRTSADSQVALPVFDKATDDRSKPRLVNGKVGIVLFEGWIVGANTDIEPELVEPGFKREVARELREYKPLFDEVDDLVVRVLRDLDAIKGMYHEQVRRQRARTEREGKPWRGLEENEIDRFVDSFYIDAWDWIHTSPEPRLEDTSLMVITDDRRNIIDMQLGGRALPFKGKTVLVTGGGTGLGRESALKFADLGANIVLMGRRYEMLQGTAREIAAKGRRVLVTPGSVSKQSDLNTVFQRIEKEFGSVDVLVNNAGVSGPVRSIGRQPLEDESSGEPDFRETVKIHLGAWAMAQRTVKLARAKNKPLTIVNVITRFSPRERTDPVPYPFRLPYVIAQVIKNFIGRAMAWELAEEDIAVTNIAFGPAAGSERIEAVVYPRGALERQLHGVSVTAEGIRSKTAELHPGGKFVTLKDVAESIIFAASESGRRLGTGEAWSMGGGLDFAVPPNTVVPTSLGLKPDLTGKNVLILGSPENARLKTARAGLEESGASVFVASMIPGQLSNTIDQDFLRAGRSLDQVVVVSDDVPATPSLIDLPDESRERLIEEQAVLPFGSAAKLGVATFILQSIHQISDRKAWIGIETLESFVKLLERPAEEWAEEEKQIFQSALQNAKGNLIFVGPELAPTDDSKKVMDETTKRALESWRMGVKAGAESLATELAGTKTHIRSNAVIPGKLSGRPGDPEALARTVLYLSAPGRNVSGLVIYADERNAQTDFTGSSKPAGDGFGARSGEETESDSSRDEKLAREIAEKLRGRDPAIAGIDVLVAFLSPESGGRLNIIQQVFAEYMMPTTPGELNGRPRARNIVNLITSVLDEPYRGFGAAEPAGGYLEIPSEDGKTVYRYERAGLAHIQRFISAYPREPKLILIGEDMEMGKSTLLKNIEAGEIDLGKAIDPHYIIYGDALAIQSLWKKGDADPLVELYRYAVRKLDLKHGGIFPEDLTIPGSGGMVRRAALLLSENDESDPRQVIQQEVVQRAHWMIQNIASSGQKIFDENENPNRLLMLEFAGILEGMEISAAATSALLKEPVHVLLVKFQLGEFEIRETLWSPAGFGVVPDESDRALLEELRLKMADSLGHIAYRDDFEKMPLEFDLRIIAHGMTKANELGVFTGSQADTDLNQLNPEGERQAQEGAKALWDELGGRLKAGETIYFLYSPLPRAKRTADYFMGYAKAQGVEIKLIPEPDAVEIAVDVWNSEADDEAYRNLDSFVRPKSGESYIRFLKRVKQFVEKLNRDYKGKTVVVYGHRTFATALRVLLDGPGNPLTEPYIRWRDLVPNSERGKPIHFQPSGYGAGEEILKEKGATENQSQSGRAGFGTKGVERALSVGDVSDIDRSRKAQESPRRESQPQWSWLKTWLHLFSLIVGYNNHAIIKIKNHTSNNIILGTTLTLIKNWLANAAAAMILNISKRVFDTISFLFGSKSSIAAFIRTFLVSKELNTELFIRQLIVDKSSYTGQPYLQPAAGFGVSAEAQTVAGLLKEWQEGDGWKRRPEPQEAAKFSEEDIRSGARLAGFPEPEMDLTLRELNNILPYLRQMVEHTLKSFPDHKLLILGRDAEALYDAFKTVLSGTSEENRVMLYPGSMALLKNWNRRNVSRQRKLAFFNRYGISKESIERGEKFLFIDTGFSGTFASMTRSEIGRLFGYPDTNGSFNGHHKKISELFVSRLISGNGVYQTGLLWPVPITRDDFKNIFVKIADSEEVLHWAGLHAAVFKSGNTMLASSLQLLPRFHGPYSKLVSYGGGQVVAEPSERGEITVNIDAVEDPNESKINPYGALLAQQKVVSYFASARESILNSTGIAEIKHGDGGFGARHDRAQPGPLPDPKKGPSDPAKSLIRDANWNGEERARWIYLGEINIRPDAVGPSGSKRHFVFAEERRVPKRQWLTGRNEAFTLSILFVDPSKKMPTDLPDFSGAYRSHGFDYKNYADVTLMRYDDGWRLSTFYPVGRDDLSRSESQRKYSGAGVSGLILKYIQNALDGQNVPLYSGETRRFSPIRHFIQTWGKSVRAGRLSDKWWQDPAEIAKQGRFFDRRNVGYLWIKTGLDQRRTQVALEALGGDRYRIKSLFDTQRKFEELQEGGILVIPFPSGEVFLKDQKIGRVFYTDVEMFVHSRTADDLNDELTRPEKGFGRADSVKGVGPNVIKALVEEGIVTLGPVIQADPEKAARILRDAGYKSGADIQAKVELDRRRILERIESLDLNTLIISADTRALWAERLETLRAAFGDRRLRPLLVAKFAQVLGLRGDLTAGENDKLISEIRDGLGIPSGRAVVVADFQRNLKVLQESGAIPLKLDLTKILLLGEIPPNLEILLGERAASLASAELLTLIDRFAELDQIAKTFAAAA